MIKHQGAGVMLQVQGCKECLILAIAYELETLPAFKEIINRAVRLANDRKASKEN